MAQNWLNNGETVRLVNTGSLLSHPSVDIKSGDLVLVGADVANVVLKGVAMTDIVLAANIGEFKYNEGSICRIGEWKFPAILSAARAAFVKLNYHVVDKLFVDAVAAGPTCIAGISMVDPKVEPKQLVDASGIITLTTFAVDGTGAGLAGNEIFEITITEASDLAVPTQAKYSIKRSRSPYTEVTGLVVGTVYDAAALFGTNSFDLTLTAVAGKDLFPGQKFYIAVQAANNANVVVGAGMLTEAAIIGAHVAIPTSTIGKGLNQDEGVQGNVGKLPILINI